MDNTSIKKSLRSYMKKYYRKHEIEDDENIFELGIINSLFTMQLIIFLEDEFNVTINNSDFDIEKFQSIEKIAELIESKLV